MSLRERLADMTRLNRARVDVVINRIHNNPALMLVFNGFLLGFGVASKAKSYIVTRLNRLGIDLGARARLRLADYAIPEDMPPQSIRGRLRVLLVVEESVSQCFIYRVRQKLDMLRLLEIDAKWVSWRDIREARRQMHFHHVVIFYRVPGFPDVDKAIHYANALNKVVIYDVDDLIFDHDRLAEKFRQATGQLSSTERIAMLNGARLYLKALQTCGTAMSSTHVLAGELARHIDDQVQVLPNGVDPVVAAVSEGPHPPREPGYTDIFYGSGTKTHDQDFASVAGVLAELLNAFPALRIVIVGHLSLPDALRPFEERIQRLPLLDFDNYLYVLSLADINIAPLEEGVFADCKSEIKWLEAAMVNVPSVVTATRTYTDVIEDGVDGCLARSGEDWRRALTGLIESPELRDQMAARARQRARHLYTLSALARRLKEILDHCLATRQQLGQVVLPSATKKRLLFVNTVYPPTAIGGATVVLTNIVAELQQRYADQYELAVFAYDLRAVEPYELNEYAWNGVRVTVISMPVHPSADWLYRDDEVRRLFHEYLLAHQPDLIHFHSIQRLTASVCEAAADAGIPYVTTVHDAWWLSDHQFLINDHGQLVPALQRNPFVAAQDSEDPNQTVARSRYLDKQLRGSARVLAVSEYQQSLYRENGFDRIEVNRNGVHAPQIDTTAQAEGPNLILGYLGGVTAHKGYDFLRDCVARSNLTHTQIRLIDFELKNGERQTQHWGNTEVTSLPPFAAAHIGAWFDTIHVLVVPSIWPESFGLVTREAVLAHTWVVAADAGALAEEVEEGRTGHVFEMGNADALMDLLKQMDANVPHYQQPAAGPSTPIQTVAGQVEELAGIYESLLPRPPATREADCAG